MDLTCTVCGESYVPSGRDPGDVCPWCAVNFRGSQECAGHIEGEPALVLTPRQVEAMRRVAEHWHRERGETP